MSTQETEHRSTTKRRIRVRRGPAGTREYQEFSVPVGRRTTVLDALEYIRAREDASLQYRHSCHHGSCGTCGMLINGRQKLACLAGIEEAVAEEQDADGDEDAGGNADGAPASERGTDADARRADADLVVEPLDAFTHIRDLAVDPTGFFDRFPSGARYLRSSETNRDAPVAPEAAGDGSYAGYERFENCIECGLCISACPVTKAFVGPATLAAFHRELKNAPERREEILGMVDTEDGVWACQRALNCSRVCPTEVYPAKHIAMLQREIKKERG